MSKPNKVARSIVRQEDATAAHIPLEVSMKVEKEANICGEESQNSGRLRCWKCRKVLRYTIHDTHFALCTRKVDESTTCNALNGVPISSLPLAEGQTFPVLLGLPPVEVNCSECGMEMIAKKPLLVSECCQCNAILYTPSLASPELFQQISSHLNMYEEG
eukprot:GHVT01098257.1.p1 GENE.GHVT01098257.1~~GHVT01098257.1.p1  ORF type:complete len:160 (+),score=1.99 GHVT01098257.1:828-1307(+)